MPEILESHYIFRVFPNPLFGEPVVCTLDSRGLVISVVPMISLNPALNSLFVAVQLVFVVFVIFVIAIVFVKGGPHANHRSIAAQGAEPKGRNPAQGSRGFGAP